MGESTQIWGNAIEATIISKLIMLGHRVCLPFGESAPYDVVVEFDGICKRIQIKKIYKDNSAHRSHNGTYQCNFRKSLVTRNNGDKNRRNRHYTKDDCDYFICYLPEEDVSYIYPIEAVSDKWSANIRNKNTKHSKLFSDSYLEAWHLLEHEGE